MEVDIPADQKVRVRTKLNEEKIRLWLPPYTKPDGRSKGDEPLELANRYASELTLPADVVLSVFEELRSHACAKLYQRQNCVSVRVKMVGDTHIQNQTNESAEVERKMDFEQTQTGQDVKRLIREVYGLEESVELKLIVSGAVLKDDLTLATQNVRTGMIMMVLRTDGQRSPGTEESNPHPVLDRTRHAAEFLMRNSNGGLNENYSIALTDQAGKPLKLPQEEEQALTVAMMLCERGRAKLKRKQFCDALPFLLEADAEFKKCRSDILMSVDNYPVLCLDIVWCYLCLRNVTDLPDAELKLRECEEGFRRCYGPNVERLQLVKGGTEKEKALFARLHLLQGILAYHQNRFHQAKQLLNRTRDELNLLRVEESSMMQVMEMGFTSQEARLGLRATAGNIQAAVAHIMNQRQKRQELLDKEKKERKQKRLAQRLGPTADGNLVNMDYYENLVTMGYSKGAAAEALKQANNDLNNAIQILAEHPELLSLPDPDIDRRDVPITEEMIDSLVGLGFDRFTVETALRYFHADMERAVEGLMANGGVLPQQWISAVQALSASTSSASSTRSDSSMESTSPGSTGAEGGTPDGGGVGGLTREECERLIDEEIREDITGNEEDYLDLELNDEESLLDQYQALLLSSAPST